MIMKNLLENIIKTVLFEDRVVGKVSSLPMKEFDAAIAAGAVFAFEVSSKGVTKPSEVLNNVVGSISSNPTVGASSNYSNGKYFYIVSDPIQNDKRQKIVVWVYPNSSKYGTFDTLRQNYAKMGIDQPVTNTNTSSIDPVELARDYRKWANHTPELKSKYGETSPYKLDVKTDPPNDSNFEKSYAVGKTEFEKDKTKNEKEIAVKYNPATMAVKYIGQSPIMNRAVYERILKDLKQADAEIKGVDTDALQSKENIIFNKGSEETVTEPESGSEVNNVVTPTPTTTPVTPTPSPVTNPTAEQLKLAKDYRTWANSTPELKSKYGKTSPYDLDATSSKPYNTNFEKSYAVGKADFDKRTPGTVTPPAAGRKKGDVITLKPGTVTLYYKNSDGTYKKAASILAGNDLSKNKVTINDVSGDNYYITISGKSYWINKSVVK